MTPNTIFVAQNTRAKRTELEEQAVQTFYLTNISQQNDLTICRRRCAMCFQSAKIYGVASQNAIIMRGTPDELLLAQKLIDDLDKARAGSCGRCCGAGSEPNWERNIGIQLPQTATVWRSRRRTTTATNTGRAHRRRTRTGTRPRRRTTSNGLTLNNFAHLNGTNFAVTIGSGAGQPAADRHFNTKILQNPRIRASDGQEATLKIGERIPIATGSYQTGAATAIVSSLVNTQFQYLDVGVNIKIKPTVHFDRDVTLKMKIEVSSQNGSTTHRRRSPSRSSRSARWTRRFG